MALLAVLPVRAAGDSLQFGANQAHIAPPASGVQFQRAIVTGRWCRNNRAFRAPLRTGYGHYGARPCCRRAALTVLSISIVTVIGPTPPGTGVRARHFGATWSWFTSPHSR